MAQWMNDPKKRNITIYLIDHAGAPVVTWTLIDALPVKLEAPTLDADRNAIAIEGIEVAASELKMEYTKPGQDLFPGVSFDDLNPF